MFAPLVTKLDDSQMRLYPLLVLPFPVLADDGGPGGGGGSGGKMWPFEPRNELDVVEEE